MRARVAVIAALAAAVLVAPASGGFPGRNGAIVFVSSRADGAMEIFSMQSDGSSPLRLTQGQPPGRNAAWSPDGGRLAFLAGPLLGVYELWTMRRDGTGLRRVTRGIDLNGRPAWSPDGRRLAFPCPTGPDADVGSYRLRPVSICVVRTDGTHRERVTESRKGQADGSPTWSPNGGEIAFDRFSASTDRFDIYVVNLRTARVRALTKTRRDLESNPAWSRQGWIAFNYSKAIGHGSGDNFSAPDIFVMRGDGSAKRNVTRSPRLGEVTPSWSPDAKEIVCESDGAVYVVTSDGAESHRLAFETRRASYSQNPAWSPDGDKIALDGEGGWLWLVNPDGTAPTPLLRGIEFATPAVSADGSSIAFTTYDGVDSGFHLMNSDGTNARAARGGPNPSWAPDGRRVTFESDTDIGVIDIDGSGQDHFSGEEHHEWYKPAWSPDGTKIAFEEWVHGDGPTIYVLLLASRKAKRLERGGAPAWSPDGKRIAFVRDNSINVMNAADGSGVRKVTGRGFQPAWSPDGKKIAFVRMLGTNSEIFVVNVDGSGTKRLTHNPGPDANPDWQPLPKTLAYASATSVASRSAP